MEMVISISYTKDPHGCISESAAMFFIEPVYEAPARTTLKQGSSASCRCGETVTNLLSSCNQPQASARHEQSMQSGYEDIDPH